MSRRTTHPVGPAAVAALAVLISLEVVAVGVPAAVTLASNPAAILNPDLGRRSVASLISRLGEGVRNDDLLDSLRQGQQSACMGWTSACSLPAPPSFAVDQPACRPCCVPPLADRLLDLPPPIATLA